MILQVELSFKFRSSLLVLYSSENSSSAVRRIPPTGSDTFTHFLSIKIPVRISVLLRRVHMLSSAVSVITVVIE